MKRKHDDGLVSAMFSTTGLIRECVSGRGTVDPFSLAQFKVLALVAERGNPTMKDVAESLHITSPSATSIINRLVGTKKLARTYDKNDRRIVRLQITQKGREGLLGCRKDITKKMDGMLCVLNKKEQASLLKILTKVINGNA